MRSARDCWIWPLSDCRGRRAGWVNGDGVRLLDGYPAPLRYAGRKRWNPMAGMVAWQGQLGGPWSLGCGSRRLWDEVRQNWGMNYAACSSAWAGAPTRRERKDVKGKRGLIKIKVMRHARPQGARWRLGLNTSLERKCITWEVVVFGETFGNTLGLHIIPGDPLGRLKYAIPRSLSCVCVDLGRKRKAPAV